MSNEMKLFTSVEFGNVRATEINGREYFCASDIAKALGYSKPNNAISHHCRSTLKQGIPHPQAKDKVIEMSFIPESDVYRLIIKSKLPNAEKFEKWLMEDVLPTIRKHGMYAQDETIENMLNNPDVMIKTLTALKKEREKVLSLEKENEMLIPDAEMPRDIVKYSGMYTLKEVSDLVDAGRTELCSLLRTNKVLSKQTGYNLPLRKYINQGYFKVKMSDKYITPVTMVTGKGLKFIYNLIKKNNCGVCFNVEKLLNIGVEMDGIAYVD